MYMYKVGNQNQSVVLKQDLNYSKNEGIRRVPTSFEYFLLVSKVNKRSYQCSLL